MVRTSNQGMYFVCSAGVISDPCVVGHSLKVNTHAHTYTRPHVHALEERSQDRVSEDK